MTSLWIPLYAYGYQINNLNITATELNSVTAKKNGNLLYEPVRPARGKWLKWYNWKYTLDKATESDGFSAMNTQYEY
jgi:hypothetical protein